MLMFSCFCLKFKLKWRTSVTFAWLQPFLSEVHAHITEVQIKIVEVTQKFWTSVICGWSSQQKKYCGLRLYMLISNCFCLKFKLKWSTSVIFAWFLSFLSEVYAQIIEVQAKIVEVREIFLNLSHMWLKFTYKKYWTSTIYN